MHSPLLEGETNEKLVGGDVGVGVVLCMCDRGASFLCTQQPNSESTLARHSLNSIFCVLKIRKTC
jgi:hypothetical protein